MDSYTILSTELRDLAQSLNGNISELQKKADKLQKVINKVTRGDYNASDLSAAYHAQSTLAGSITRLDEICGAINSAASQFSEASAELSGRANLTAYYMQHTSTLSYEGLMGTYTTAIASVGSASAGYEVVKGTLSADGYPVGTLGSVSSAVQDAIQREAEEQARRAEEAQWAKIGLTGLVIVGGIVASAVTGGAAAPIVIGAISGAVMAGGNTAIDQYAEHGWETDKWDYAKIGKDTFVGGVTGAATAWIGGNLTKGVTNYVSGTQWGSTLLNSSNAYARVGVGAVIGSASEVVSGVGSRGTGTFISTMVETNGDFGKSLSNAKESALDVKQIVKDAVLGGVRGGKQQYSEKKTAPTSVGEDTQSLERDITDWEKIRTSSTASEEQMLLEMEANGELTIRASEMGHSSVDMSVPRISEEPIELDMSFKSDKVNVDEFYGQGHMQEDALNNLTVEEYFNNYNSRVQNGRAAAGTEAQREYRFIAKEITTDDLMEANPALSYQEARKMATETYRKSAALHNPDQIAGGDPTQIHAIGGSRENSVFGALWGRGRRAEQLHDKIVELTENMTPEEMKMTRLHVKFNMPK